MTKQNLIKYLDAAVDVELDIYKQEQALKKIQKMHDNLGVARWFSMPKNKKGSIGLFDDAIEAAMAGAVPGGIVGGIIGFISADIGSGYFLKLIGSVILGGIVGILIAVIICVINNQRMINEANQTYEDEYERYITARKNDERRVSMELAKKKSVATAIADLQGSIQQSKRLLKDIYGANVLHPQYRNIHAMTYICSYFEEGRTNSLEFDPQTGDQGAYNIYRLESLLTDIAYNTYEIISRLDEISNKIDILIERVDRVHNSIERMSSEVERYLNNYDEKLNDIRHFSSITAENAVRTRKAVEYLALVDLINRVDS